MVDTGLGGAVRAGGSAGMMAGDGVTGTVMSVLRGIRAARANGVPYDFDTNLTDAGFTSVEMVKVMLGVEAAFDLMIPQDMITPENFTSPATISEMVNVLIEIK